MAIAVDIVVSDNTVSPQPIQGVAINVYDTGGVLQASGVTDSSGTAAFMLPGAASPGGVAYEVRAFKLGVIFSNPTQILVFDPLPGGSTNTFDLAGTLLTIDTALDPRCCRCTGRFLNFANKPVVGALVRILAKVDIGPGLQVPKIVDGNLISAEAMEFHTDSDGNVVFDLLRTGEYYVSYSGEDEYTWNIKVPDRSSANLIDLLFPQPVSLTWDQTAAPGNSVTIHVNDSVTIPFTLLFSDFETNPESLGKWIFFDPDSVLVATTGLTTDEDGNFIIAVKGASVGTMHLTPTLYQNLAPVRVPAYSLSAAPLTINVVS